MTPGTLRTNGQRIKPNTESEVQHASRRAEKNTSIPKDKTPTKAPAKRTAEEVDQTPEEKQPKKKERFGGKQDKYVSCQLCGCERASDQKGAFCCFCIAATRQLLKHQRVVDVMGGEHKEAVKAKSDELRSANPSSSTARDRGTTKLNKLVQQLQQVVATFPQMRDIISRLEALEAKLADGPM